MKIFFAFQMAILLMLAGCNTFEGIGKDVERGGEKVQDGARTTKEKM